MNRISVLIAKKGKSKLLVPFFTAGYPGVDTALELVRGAIDAGADMIELGMPFSDPMADGPEIQFSSQVALKRGVNLNTVFETVKRIRRYSSVPVILMGYFNPVFTFGIERFVRASADSGVDGFILPDLPVDEARAFRDMVEHSGLSAVFLVAPTSPVERVKAIAEASTDFVYAVTVAGVTGGNRSFDRSVDGYLRRLRKQLNKPFVAGFGVSSPESAKRLARHADGVVIGSALIRAYRTAPGRSEGVRAVSTMLQRLRRALG